MTRAALYARVSTDDKGQSTENQLVELRRFAAAQGWAQMSTPTIPIISAGEVRLRSLHLDPLHSRHRQLQPTPSFSGEMAYGNAPYQKLWSLGGGNWGRQP